MGVFIRSMGSPDYEDMKKYMGRLFSRYPLLGVLGVWMTFKKAEMEKTLRNGLNLSEMDPINNKWLDFAI